jgi:hypothetical protein
MAGNRGISRFSHLKNHAYTIFDKTRTLLRIWSQSCWLVTTA